MNKTLTILIILIAAAGCGEERELYSFENCYNESKYDALRVAIKKLDIEIESAYPDTNIINSYIKYAVTILKSGGLDGNVLSSNEVKVISKNLKDNGVIDDIFTFEPNGRGTSFNFEGEYYNCLSKSSDDLVENYINTVEASGNNPPLAMVLDGLIKVKTHNYNSIQIFILKTELILCHIKSNEFGGLKSSLPHSKSNPK